VFVRGEDIMPVLTLKCPECGHIFHGLVLAGTRPPEVWVCSRCGSEQAQPAVEATPAPHPWEAEHGGGKCLCCG
jgi:hypothetical protein